MSLIRKGVLNMTGTVSLTAISMVTGILLARYLEPEGMGQYQLCLTTVILVVTLVNLGVGQASIYFINNQRKSPEETATTSLVFGVVAGAFSAMLLFAMLQIKSYFGVLPLRTIVVLSVGGWVLSCQTSILPVLMAHLQIKRHISVQMLRSLLALVLVCSLILLSLLTVSSALTIQALGIVGSFILLLCFLRKYLKKWPNSMLGLLRRMIRFGLQLSASSIINLLNINIGLFLVRYFLAEDFSYVGQYGRAAAIASMLLLLPAAIGPVLYSRWSGLSLDERVKQVGMATRLMVALGLTVCAVLVFSAKWIVLLMYGTEYMPAVLPLRIMAVGLFLRFILYPLLQLFPSSGHPLLASVPLGASLVSAAGTMMILIPRYSIAGAAASVAIGNLLAVVIGYTIAVRKFGINLTSCLIVRTVDIRYVLRSFRPQ